MCPQFATNSVYSSGVRKILHKLVFNYKFMDRHTYKHRPQTKISPVPVLCPHHYVLRCSLISCNCCQEVVKKLLHKSSGSFISHLSVLLGKVVMPFLIFLHAAMACGANFMLHCNSYTVYRYILYTFYIHVDVSCAQ